MYSKNKKINVNVREKKAEYKKSIGLIWVCMQVTFYTAWSDHY